MRYVIRAENLALDPATDPDIELSHLPGMHDQRSHGWRRKGHGTRSPRLRLRPLKAKQRKPRLQPLTSDVEWQRFWLRIRHR